MLFLSLVIGFFIGVGTSTSGYLNSLFLCGILPLSAILFERRTVFMAMVGILGLLLGGWTGHHAYESEKEKTLLFQQISKSGYEKVGVVGTVSDRLYQNDFTKTYRLELDTVNDKILDTQLPIGILIEVPKNLSINVGDILLFTGKLLPIISEVPPNGFGRYAWYHGTYGRIYLPVFSLIQRTPENWRETTQNWTETIMFQGFPRDVAGMILGMVLGNTNLLSTDVKDSFILSGTSHILVVSGSNIAFVILIITGILRYIPTRKGLRLLSITLFVLTYSILVGWEVPVIRATIMGILSYIAIEYGKRVSSISLLLFIGAVLLIFQPLSLLYDAGFGLSFGATLGILLFYENISGFFRRVKVPSILASILGVTLAATIGSTPMIIYYFGVIPTGMILANILIAGFIGAMMILGVAYLVAALFVGGVALYWFGFFLYIPAKIILSITQFFSYGGVIEIPGIWQSLIPLGVFGYITISMLNHEIHRMNSLKKE